MCVCNGTAGGFSGRFITKFDSFWPVSAVCTHIVRGYKRAAAIGDAGTRQVGGRNINLAISCCLRVNISTRWSVRKKYCPESPRWDLSRCRLGSKFRSGKNERLLVTSGRAVDHRAARYYSACLRWEGVAPLTNHLKGSAAIVCWRLVVV